VLAAVAATLAGAAGASAVVVKLRHNHYVSYQPLRHSHAGLSTFDVAFSNLDYNGGPVMPSNTNYTLYWDPAKAPRYPVGYKEGVDRYLEDLAHDSGGHENVDSVATQYDDAAGHFANYESHFGGEMTDIDEYPANGCSQATICLTDAQLQAELTKFVNEHELPTDLEAEYFLLLPPKVETCFEGTVCSAGANTPVYCAYHSNIPLAGGHELIYAVDGFVGSGIAELLCTDGNFPNGVSDSALEGGLSHEHNESTTDPEPNSAWADIAHEGFENGDKCRTGEEASEFGTALGEEAGVKWNQVVNGHHYWYQQEWSNQGHQCLQRFTFSGEQPVAAFTATPGTGDTVKFDASGSTAAGGVAHYNWQFNDGPGLSKPVETTTPTVSHTFPKTAPFNVALTVFAGDGTSMGTAHTVAAGSAPPAVTRVAPAKGPAAGGIKVTITGKNLGEANAVSFGGAGASFKVVTPSQITATAPAGSPGIVDVRVTTPWGTSPIALTDHYKYIPTVTEVSPNAGPKAGGTNVTISGSGFATGAGETIIKFGGSAATNVSCESSTRCTVTSPKHAVATVDVIATVNKVSSLKAPPGDQFTYS
jgi:hypothetical protein